MCFIVLFLSVFRHRPAAPAAESVRMRKGYMKPSFQSRPVFSRTKRKRILHLLLDFTAALLNKIPALAPLRGGRKFATICAEPLDGLYSTREALPMRRGGFDREVGAPCNILELR